MHLEIDVFQKLIPGRGIQMVRMGAMWDQSQQPKLEVSLGTAAKWTTSPSQPWHSGRTAPMQIQPWWVSMPGTFLDFFLGLSAWSKCSFLAQLCIFVLVKDPSGEDDQIIQHDPTLRLVVSTAENLAVAVLIFAYGACQ